MQSIMDALGVDLSLPSVVIQHDHKYAWYLFNQQTGPFRDVVISSMLHPVTQWYVLYFSTVIYFLWLRMQCSLSSPAPSPTICRVLLFKLFSLNCVNLIFCCHFLLSSQFRSSFTSLIVIFIIYLHCYICLSVTFCHKNSWIHSITKGFFTTIFIA